MHFDIDNDILLFAPLLGIDSDDAAQCQIANENPVHTFSLLQHRD